MTPQDHARAAADLLAAEKSGDQIGLLSLRHPEIGMDDAYAVQNAICTAKLAQGRRVIGWKIGLTSKAMQYALGIDIPDSGILFDVWPSTTAPPCPRAGLSSRGSRPRSPLS